MSEIIITEELVAKLAAAEAKEDVIQAFSAEGIDITEEQLEALAAAEAQEGELSEDSLDSVAGGSILSAFKGIRFIYPPFIPFRPDWRKFLLFFKK